MRDRKLDTLRKLCNDDEHFMKEMIQIFIKTSRESLSYIIEGIKEGNLESVGSYAHKLKSSIQIVGDPELHSLLKSIELNAKTGDENEKLKNEGNSLTQKLEVLNLFLQSQLE